MEGDRGEERYSREGKEVIGVGENGKEGRENFYLD